MGVGGEDVGQEGLDGVGVHVRGRDGRVVADGLRGVVVGYGWRVVGAVDLCVGGEKGDVVS
jgi:hypothetical protein